MINPEQLLDEIAIRRTDEAFMARLRERIDEDRPVLDRLTADPDAPCPHERFEASVDVGRLSDEEGGPIIGYSATIRVWCEACGEPFVWIGVDPGLSPREPRVSVDAVALQAPLRPQTSPEDFGLDGPGFDVRRVI